MKLKTQGNPTVARRRLYFGTPCFGALCLAAVLVPAAPAFAQRADDNAVTAAQDAFGTVVGNESIGLYSASSARGFSPTDAGNIRLEGLYFDRQAALQSRLVRGSSIRVGISAQSYPFVAPTGIADYNLRIPDDTPLASVVAKYGPYDSTNIELDSKFPVIPDKLSIGLGANAGYTERGTSSGDSYMWAGAVIGRWRVAEEIEVLSFYSRNEDFNHETTPRIYMAGPFLPPTIERNLFWNQDWADFAVQSTNFGTIGRATFLQDWRLQAGLFRSLNTRVDNTVATYRNTTAAGLSDRIFTSFPPTRSASTSGEVRLSRVFAEGPRQHTLYLATKGRSVKRAFGGSVTVADGPVLIGVKAPVAPPAGLFNYGPRGGDSVRELAPGISYMGLWRGVGELSAGVQRSYYKRTLHTPGLPSTETESSPWLYNATLTTYISERLALYGSYTRGLEDGGTAPERAINPGESAPATITQQVDVGMRYALTPRVRLVAGLFKVTKPRYDIDTTNFFTRVGQIKHEGIELSVTGDVAEGLTVIGGVVLLRVRLSGGLVDQGLVGLVPPDSNPRAIKLNVQYAPPFLPAFSFDAQIDHGGAKFTDATNTLKVPSLTTLNLGARYKFEAFQSPATLRLQVENVTSTYKWTLGTGRSLIPEEPRRVTLQLAVDF
jgi:iron complex outermembrane receptor protein